MARIWTLLALLPAGPALAASGEYGFVSLRNSDFVVLISFLIFLGVLTYFRVPQLLGGMLDKRAETVRNDLEEARALREEAQTVLAEFERKQKDVQDQARHVVAQAKAEAQAAAEQAKADLEKSIARRMQAAEDQIASAEAAAVREGRNKAITVAVAAAARVVREGMTEADAAALIDSSIRTVEAKLH